MFSFFKKRAAEPEPAVEQKPAVDTAALGEERAALAARLAEVEGEARVDTLNRLGDLSFRLSDVDAAISYYETSLKEHPALGKAHGELLKLYNSKRREAAEAKDDARLQIYMDKIDALMNLTKTAMRTI